MKTKLGILISLLGLFLGFFPNNNIVYSQDCPGGSGPNGITAGSYVPQHLTQEERQWLWNAFGNNPSEIAPDGYGGEFCGGETTYRCPPGTGPNGITAGLYEPTLLTQEQRNWLYHRFGNMGEAPVGYGGEACGGDSGGGEENTIALICEAHATERGPRGIRIGAYQPEHLNSAQRQWLWNLFNPNEQGHTPPDGWSGEFCPWQNGEYYPDPRHGEDESPDNDTGDNQPPPLNPNPPTASQARELTNGGIHVAVICEVWGYGSNNITVTEGDANSWRCANGTLVDFNRACREAWGENYQATIADTNDIYGWRCVTSNQGNSSTPIDYGSNSPQWERSLRITASSGLNIRSGPGTNYEIIGRAVYNAWFEIIGDPVNGWYNIRFRLGEGWVSSQFTEIRIPTDVIWCNALFYGGEQGLDPNDANDNTDIFYIFLVPQGTTDTKVMPDSIRNAWRGPTAALRNDQIAEYDTRNLDAYAIVLGTYGQALGWQNRIYLQYRFIGEHCPTLEL